MATSDDIKLEALHDHYKETFGILREAIKLRDYMFFLILVFTTILLFEMFSPAEAASAIVTFITQHLELEQSINISFIGSVLWFTVLALTLRYCQTVISIEKQYKYIHKLESKLSTYFSGEVFTREGKSYFKNYSYFSNCVWILYTVLFPAVFLMVIIAKIINEWRCLNSVSFLTWLNSGFASAIIVLVVFYLFQLHGKTK